MSEIFNIYCDESGHLPADEIPVMVLGAVMCPLGKTREIATRIREIKQKHGIPPAFEIKWTNVSPAKEDYYLDLVDYFFDDDDLRFRAVVADKTSLNHDHWNQTHDDWYYKMMYQLIVRLLEPDSSYRIYLDKKDTRGGEKASRLHDILANKHHDFDKRIVQRLQIVQSHEVEQLQLADLLLGSISYANRRLKTSSAKMEIISRVKARSGTTLLQSTLPQAQKFNIFQWEGRA